MSLADFGSNVKKDGDSGANPAMARVRALLDGNANEQEEDGDLFKVSKSQWAVCGSSEFTGIQKTQKSLTAGVYRVKLRNGEVVMCKADINVDDLLEFPDSLSDTILKEINDFWEKADLFKKYGFLHRRGYLMYGPAGGGKTSLVQQIIKKIIDRDGLVFICDNPSILAMGLAVFREIEPKRNVVCIFEDLDSIIDSNGEDTILSILDGELQIDKVLNIATTNYPENLDKRLVGRPRRFDRVIRIGMPNEAVRRLYFSTKLGITDDELVCWVKKTDEFSFAAMAELVISVKCLGHNLDESVKTLRELLDSKPSSSGDGKPVGFGGR
jgi:hypothetical protein